MRCKHSPWVNVKGFRLWPKPVWLELINVEPAASLTRFRAQTWIFLQGIFQCFCIAFRTCREEFPLRRCLDSWFIGQVVAIRCLLLSRCFLRIFAEDGYCLNVRNTIWSRRQFYWPLATAQDEGEAESLQPTVWYKRAAVCPSGNPILTLRIAVSSIKGIWVTGRIDTLWIGRILLWRLPTWPRTNGCGIWVHTCFWCSKYLYLMWYFVNAFWSCQIATNQISRAAVAGSEVETAARYFYASGDQDPPVHRANYTAA